MKTTVVVPTFNEAGNLYSLVLELFRLPIAVDVLVVDDGSSDGTAMLADKLAAETNGRLAVIHRTGRRGLGVSYVDGFKAALAAGADVVVQMDADFSHAPSDVPRLVKALEGADVAIGSRYASGGSVDEQWTAAGRAALSRWANVYSKSILGLKVNDATAGFKAWRGAALRAMNLDRVRSNGYIFQEEMAFLAQKNGLKTVEVPIHFSERKTGESKMSLKIKVEGAVGIFRIRLRHGGRRGR